VTSWASVWIRNQPKPPSGKSATSTVTSGAGSRGTTPSGMAIPLSTIHRSRPLAPWCPLISTVVCPPVPANACSTTLFRASANTSGLCSFRPPTAQAASATQAFGQSPRVQHPRRREAKLKTRAAVGVYPWRAFPMGLLILAAHSARLRPLQRRQRQNPFRSAGIPCPQRGSVRPVPTASWD